MKHDTVSPISGSPALRGLGHVLQGVQHVGVTVDDMAKSLEFYVGVLGGRIAALGDKILEPLKVKAIERIRRMVRHHHEFYDGKGYPDGLRGTDIPLGARILSVADSFDTMVTPRAYKRGRSVEEAVAELRRCSDTQFDRELVAAFVSSLASVGDPRKRDAFEQAAI